MINSTKHMNPTFSFLIFKKVHVVRISILHLIVTYADWISTFKSIINNPFLRFTFLCFLHTVAFPIRAIHNIFYADWNSITKGLIKKPIFYYSAEWKRSWYVTLYTERSRTVCMIQNKVILQLSSSKEKKSPEDLII